MDNLLEIRNLKTQFFTQGRVIKAVNDVSYDIRRGETLAIVGESGCGKSVTALSIMRLIPWPPGKIVGGSVMYKGKDLLKASSAEMRAIRGSEISMVFQEPMTSLNPVLTIGRQLTETLHAHRKISTEDAEHKAAEMLEKVGISDPGRRLTQYPHQFSGGMRQRVMIAMALICEPSLILADEPTTALDVTIQAQILSLMKDLCKNSGASLVLITHNLGVVARYADRVNVMYAGKIAEQGTAEDIYAKPSHPYTLGLLNSVPRLDAGIHKKLEPIEGQPPDLGMDVAACRFLPRCRFGDENTCGQFPPLSEIGSNHWSACYKHAQLNQPA